MNLSGLTPAIGAAFEKGIVGDCHVSFDTMSLESRIATFHKLTKFLATIRRRHASINDCQERGDGTHAVRNICAVDEKNASGGASSVMSQHPTQPLPTDHLHEALPRPALSRSAGRRSLTDKASRRATADICFTIEGDCPSPHAASDPNHAGDTSHAGDADTP